MIRSLKRYEARSTMDHGPALSPVVHNPVDQVYGDFLYEINSLNQYFEEFCKEAPVFLCNQPAAQVLYRFYT
jgi:hypothetical protein